MIDKDSYPSSTHPPIPPTSEVERLARLRLLRSRRVGVATFRRLLNEHGTAQAALAALPDIANAARETRYTPFTAQAAERELAHGQSLGAVMIHDTDATYPDALRALDSAPPILWCLGDLSLLQKPALALVGARNASSLGTRMARNLAADLGAAGHIIVSGLARGVDTAAHLAALETGTIAVQAGGVDIIYPAENATLASDIAQRGLRLSEMPFGLQPAARHFPARNRLISGLAQATIVVEAAPRSGSLITARDALDLGRDVMAVPGHPFDGRAGGCNMLIRDGATLVRSAQDVLDALRPIVAPPAEHTDVPTEKPPRQLRDTARLHQQILNRLGPSPLAEDQLLRDLAIDPAAIGPALIELELNGDIDRQPGGLLVRVN